MDWFISLILGVFVFGIILFGIFIIFPKRLSYKQSVNSKPWQQKYDVLVEEFDPQQAKLFYEDVCKLSKRYKKPQSLRSLFLQAYQFAASNNSAYSLLLYLHYLHVKTPSASFPHRKINDDFKKKLFQNKTQENRFMQICRRLKESKNLNQAIDDTQILFRLTRREIRLDAPEIKEVSLKQSQTVELLGKYLEDDTPSTIETDAHTIIVPDNNYKKCLFHLFEQNNFVLNKKEIDIFARNNGVFRDRLIQQINETYYETVDDVLIEEEGDNYTLNREYFEQIKECL